MSSGGSGATAPPIKTHSAVWTMSVAGVIGFVMAIWTALSPMLPKSTTDVVQPILQQVVANQDNIQRLVDEIKQLKNLIPPKPAVTPPQDSPTPLPVISPEVQSLQDQIKALKDLLDKQNQPPPPVQATPPPALLPSAIKAADSQGKPINGTVDPGQQFFISATAAGGTWTIIKSADSDVDAKIYGDEVSCVLRNGSVITVVHSSGQPITTSSLIIKCNQGGQPPPLVNVDPVKPPSGSRKFSVYVVEDPGVKRSAVTSNILSNLTTRQAFTSKGCEVVPVSALTDPAAVYAKQNQAPLPAIVLFDVNAKQFVKAAPLPTDLGLSLMSSMGG